MKRLATFAAVLVLFAAGCRSLDQPGGQGGGAGSAAPATAAATGSTGPAAAGATTGAPATGPSFPDDGPAGLLAAVRTERYPDHDRVVFQFHGRSTPAAAVGYRDRITTDPADLPVPLAGAKFLHVAFHGARLDTAPVVSDPAQAERYTGPTRFTPGYPVLRELATAGDFEAVLSFGLGLSTVAGLSSSSAPGVFTLDLWATAPTSLAWPVNSVSQAEELQRETESGHQPWTLVAGQVADQYVRQVLGWGGGAESTAIGPQVYQFTAGTRLAVVTVRQPLGRPGTVWVVASTVAYPA
jgi:hypothetical protein